MFFRNLTLFRFPTSLDFSQLDELLPEAALKPVGPLELSSRGFISPFGRGEEALSHRINDAIWLSVGGEDKILPGAVVNDLLQKKLQEIEQKEGRKPGGKTRKRLKDDLLHELLPRAFVKPSRTDALIDLRGEPTADTLARLATDLKLDPQPILDRMSGPEVQAVIKENHALADTMEISGTPTFVLKSMMLRGYLPLEEMRKVVAETRADG